MKLSPRVTSQGLRKQEKLVAVFKLDGARFFIGKIVSNALSIRAADREYG